MALLKPTLFFNFSKSKKLSTQLTFSRPETVKTATIINNLGKIASAELNAPRFNHNNLGRCLGILIEEQRTNILLNSLISGANLNTQSLTVSNATHTISFYGTGSIVLSGVHTATINGLGSYPTRTTYSFIPTAGTLTLTVSGEVAYSNLELGSSASSFIPTAGTAITRLADILYLSGTGFSSNYNQIEGTFVASGYDAKGTIPTIFSVAETSANLNNSHSVYLASGNLPKFDVFNTNIKVVGLTSKQLYGKGFNVVSSIKTNSYSVANYESNVLTSTSGILPAVMTRLNIGNLNNTNFINGNIASLSYYNTKLTDIDIKALANCNNAEYSISPALNIDFSHIRNIPNILSYIRNDNKGTYINYLGNIAISDSNTARFDYDPISLLCKGVLVEDTSTNLILYSSTFSNSNWIKTGTGSVTDNSVVSPMGVSNAALVTNTSGYNIFQNVLLGGAQDGTCSIFLKEGTCSSVTVSNSRLPSNQISSVVFNLATGSVTSGTGAIKNYGNGWYRCSVNFTGSSGADTNARLTIAANSVGNFSIFGGQIEQYLLSSYIPTSASTAIRNKDLFLIDGINFTSWFNYNEGTFLVEADFSGKKSEAKLFQATNDSNAEQISIYYDYIDSNLKSLVVDNNLEMFNTANTGNIVSLNVGFTTSLSYTSNMFSSILNDKNQIIDTSGSLPLPTLFRIGAGTSGTSVWNGHIKKIVYYPKSFIATKQKSIVRAI